MSNMSLLKVLGQLGDDMGKAAALAWEGSPQSDKAGEANDSSQQEEALAKKSRTTKKRSEYRRRTIELHPDVEEMLDNLRDNLLLRSHTEVMQKAIQLLALVVGDEENGRRKIYVERKDGKLQELLIL